MKKIKVLSWLLIFCFCMAGCGASEDISEAQQVLKQEGMELQAAGDYVGAVSKYEKALQLSEMKVGAAEIDLAYYKASAQYRSGDLEGAIKTYSDILALNEDVNSYLGRGILYLAANEGEKAVEDLNQALEKTGDPLIQGIIYQVNHQPDEAKKCFEQAKKEGNSESLFFLAEHYENMGDPQYALELLEEYIESGKANAEGYLSVGRHYFEDGSYKKALEIFQAGIALGESGVLKNLLQEEIACYEKQGDFVTAKELAEDYLDKYPEDAAVQKEYEFLKSR